MIDEDVAYVSRSTVYRILREANLVCPWRRRTKRRREELEKAQRPNERSGTDLMYLRIGAGQYYLVTFLDEYSRSLVHWELLSDMGGVSDEFDPGRPPRAVPAISPTQRESPRNRPPRSVS